MRYDICIFDLDGTLTDPIDGLVKGIRYAMEKLCLGDRLENPGRFIGPPLNESFREAFDLSDEMSVKAVATFREYYGVTGLYENEVYPGIARLLERLRDNGAQLAVATSKPDRFAGLVLEHFDLYRHFGIVAGDTDDAALSKEGKHVIIRIVLDALDPKREKTAVMIGDRKHDILGARAAGIDSIGITWGYGPRAELEESGATYIADSPDRLFELILG